MKKISNYVVSLLVLVLLFLVIVLYHAIPVLKNPSYSLVNIDFLLLLNKSLASAGTIMICFSVIMGPLAGFFRSLSKYVGLRRELGLMGFYSILVHVYLVLFFMPYHYPPAYFQTYWRSLLVAFIALLILVFIAFNSGLARPKKIGFDNWKRIQRLVYLALVLVMLHLVFLGKYQSWLLWLKSFDVLMPPGAFIPAIFIVLAILFRLVSFIKNNN